MSSPTSLSQCRPPLFRAPSGRPRRPKFGPATANIEELGARSGVDLWQFFEGASGGGCTSSCSGRTNSDIPDLWIWGGLGGLRGARKRPPGTHPGRPAALFVSALGCPFGYPEMTPKITHC
jgi:hypothetical protein